jgi:hypothetical protein
MITEREHEWLVRESGPADAGGHVLLLAGSLCSATLLGHWPYAAALKAVGPAMDGTLPPHRLDALVADMKRTDPRLARQRIRSYLQHLDRHGSLVPRLCSSGNRVTVVYCEKDDVSLTDKERRALEECDRIRRETISPAPAISP